MPSQRSLHHVGPVLYDGLFGREIITRYTTDLKTAGVFYSDAAGRELVKRSYLKSVRPRGSFLAFLVERHPLFRLWIDAFCTSFPPPFAILSRRKRDGDFDAGVSLAGNYYPVIMTTQIKDPSANEQMSVLMQSTHGAASLADGACDRQGQSIS